MTVTDLLTVTLSGGEVEELDYLGGDVVDILNCTGGDLIVSFDPELSGGYITLPSSSCFNGLRLSGKLYLKSDSGGDVSIKRN